MNRNDLLNRLKMTLRAGDVHAFALAVLNTPHADLADALADEPIRDVMNMLMALPQTQRAGLFSYLPQEQQDALIGIMPKDTVVRLFEHLPSDDRADIFNRLSHAAQNQLLPAMAKVEREDLLKMASYPDGSVGAVTSSDYAVVSPDSTAAQALAYLRTHAPAKETIYVVYVQDAQKRLLGTLSLRELVLAAPEQSIADLMRPDPIYARAEWPADQAAALIRRYDLLAVPVINGGQRMIGIVTVDDAMDIEKEQDATSLSRFGGSATLEGDDLDLRESSFGKMVKTRLFWLVVLTFFGVITSTYVAHQEDILSEVLVLAAFIAPIVDMGGNTGSQSATLVIRSMALGELTLRWKDIWFVIKRELPVALTMGVVICLLEAVLAYFAKGVGIEVLATVGLSMLVCTVVGGVVGAMLPFLARRIGTDPATLSSPLITSVMDLVGVFIYFGFAYLFLGHLLVSS